MALLMADRNAIFDIGRFPVCLSFKSYFTSRRNMAANVCPALVACICNWIASIIWLSSTGIGCNNGTAFVGFVAFAAASFAYMFDGSPADNGRDDGIGIFVLLSTIIQLIALVFLLADSACMIGVSTNYVFWFPVVMLLVNIGIFVRRSCIRFNRRSVDGSASATSISPPVEAVHVVVVVELPTIETV
jgi:hypothetical protein